MYEVTFSNIKIIKNIKIKKSLNVMSCMLTASTMTLASILQQDYVQNLQATIAQSLSSSLPHILAQCLSKNMCPSQPFTNKWPSPALKHLAANDKCHHLAGFRLMLCLYCCVLCSSFFASVVRYYCPQLL